VSIPLSSALDRVTHDDITYDDRRSYDMKELGGGIVSAMPQADVKQCAYKFIRLTSFMKQKITAITIKEIMKELITGPQNENPKISQVLSIPVL
jgi:hypothetical protein